MKKRREERLGCTRRPAVGPGDRRGVDPDEDFVVLRDGPLDVFESQDVRRSVPVVDNGSHAFTSSLGSLRAVDRSAVAPRPPCPIELRGPAAGRAGPSSAPGRDHPTVLRDDAAPEVRGVELHAPDRLVHRAQLGQGERRSDERRRDARDLELDADALDRIAHDPQMIERQVDLPVEHVGHRDQGGVCGVRARHDRPHVAKHREIRDRHDVHARVALGIAVGTELGQQARAIDAGLLGAAPASPPRPASRWDA